MPAVELRFVRVRLDGVQITITLPDPEEGTGRAPAIPYYGLEHLGPITEDLDGDPVRFAEQGHGGVRAAARAGGFEIAEVATPDGVSLDLMRASEER